MSNTGFVDVPTAHAGAGSTSIPGLGTFAVLAGPTIGLDGTVFLGTREGKVIGLHADGTPYWNRQLPSGETITASPAVGSDGSVYVVGSTLVRDHRTPGGLAGTARLYKFTPGGGAPPSGLTDFPRHDHGPTLLGAPSVWQFGGDEAVIVPAVYAGLSSFYIRLLAFSTAGGIMAEWEWLRSTDVEGGGGVDWWVPGWWWPAGFHPTIVPPLAAPPWAGLTIASNSGGGAPFIVLLDRFDSTVIGFTFCVGAACSPAPGFTEVFRTSHTPRRLLSSAILLPDEHTMIGSDDGVVFSGPSTIPRPPVSGIGGIYATPTLAADGRTVLVNSVGGVTGLRDGAIVARTSVAGQSLARAAASRTHVFVATTEALYTLSSGAEISEFIFPWNGGGFWSPAVGPQGHVYAMASNILFVFPPPHRHIRDVVIHGGHGTRPT